MSSAVPQLNKCCCLFSLETGAKIIGFIELIGDTALFLLGIISTFSLVGQHKNKENASDYDILLTASVYFDLSLLFELIFAGYLLIGIYKGKNSYIKIWLVVQLVFLIISIFGLILMTIIHFKVDSVDFHIIEDIISIMIHAYFLLVINSYYRKVNMNCTLLSEMKI